MRLKLWQTYVGLIYHVLDNNTVKAATGISEMNKILGKTRKLVSYFHRSSTAMGILFKKQELLLAEEHKGHKLIQDVSTRRNTLQMLERVTEQTAALQAAVTEPVIKKS